MKKLAINGDIIYTANQDRFEILEDGYLILDGDKIIKTSSDIDKNNYEIINHRGKLIIPGFVDVHIHAPQINNIGLGADRELLDWLETYTFPEEAKYKDFEFAKKSYENLVGRLLKNGITSSIMFGTIHSKSTEYLMELMDKCGLRSYIGKVNMDRNSPDFYREETNKSYEDTVKFIEDTKDRYKNVKPIVTPRFVPSCSKELMIKLGELARKYKLKTQSHLSENIGEINWVKELHPDIKNYIDVYDEFGVLKDHVNTVMAHCVWSDEHEIEILKKHQILVAHSPYSNGNLASGISPIKKMLKAGVKVGLASDISGGHEIFMGKNMVMASILSKMRYRYIDDKYEPLTDEELFYMATKGGGEFFGKVGSFEEGYKADFLVIDDEKLSDQNPRNIKERLQRFIYTGDDRYIKNVYVDGKLIYENEN